MVVQHIWCDETKEFIMWLPEVQTELVSCASGSRVPARFRNKYLKLNIITTQSGPNTDMAHQDPQVFQLTLKFQLLPKEMLLGKRDLLSTHLGRKA